jgi:hypothetical protein
MSKSKPDNGMRPLFHGRLRDLHWQALELGVLGRGVPDSNYCGDGVDGWVEFKATETHAVPLRPEQVGWILRRCRAGGRVFIATRRQHDGGPLLGDPTDELWIHEGWDAATLKAEGLLSAPPVLHNEGGPSRWDWGLVRGVLTEWVFSRGR